jgi:hypothetical protein
MTGLSNVVIVDLRDGPWRGGVPAMLAELLRRARARPGGGVHVRVEIVHTLDEAAELIDQLGRRLLAGETIVALCDEIDADLIHRHAEIYATMPAHSGERDEHAAHADRASR